MNQKTSAIIITAVAILVCGCPGIFGILLGGMFALISFMPGADIDVFGSSDPQSALSFGIGALGVGVVFLLIAAAAIFFAWRRNASAAESTNS